METKFSLNEYESSALKISLEKYISILKDQLKNINKIKHSNPENKKNVKRSLTKRINLLKDVLNKF